MYLPLVIFLGVIVFSVQIMLCIRSKKTHIRLIPAMVLTALIGFCALVFAVMGNSHGASFAAVILAMILAILLAVDAAGWLFYCFLRFIQKI